MESSKKAVFAALFFLLVVALHAQNDNKLQFANEYLNANGTMKQYANAYDQLLELMGKQFPESDTNQKGWQYLNGNKEKALLEVGDMLAAVYLDNFSMDELRKMNQFYLTDAGKQLVADRNDLTEDQQEEINVFFTSDIGKLLQTKQQSLTEDIQAVSELWSKELYETATLLLKE